MSLPLQIARQFSEFEIQVFWILGSSQIFSAHIAGQPIFPNTQAASTDVSKQVALVAEVLKIPSNMFVIAALFTLVFDVCDVFVVVDFGETP